jgi:hypothetical protein
MAREPLSGTTDEEGRGGPDEMRHEKDEIGLSSRKKGPGSHSPIEHGSTMGLVLTHFNKKQKQHGQYLLSNLQKEHLLSVQDKWQAYPGQLKKRAGTSVSLTGGTPARPPWHDELTVSLLPIDGTR